MATPRTTWDPRSEQAAESTERMALEDWDSASWPARTIMSLGIAPERERIEETAEPQRIIILACGHWAFEAVQEITETNGQRSTTCFRHWRRERVVKVCQL